MSPITLSLRQVRLATIALAASKGEEGLGLLVGEQLDKFSPREESALEDVDALIAAPPPNRLVAPPLPTLMPLLPQEGLSPRAVAAVEGMARTYGETMRGRRPAGRLFRDDELTSYAFAWHRARSIRTALAALEREREVLGDDFDEDSLSRRATRWVILGEAASLLGVWKCETPVGAAMLVVGSGLRSAHWLWLEDDDRAMSVLRCVLEQSARARVWRTRGDAAARLEAREQTTPRDWLEQAGWRRLTALNRALGEFSHVREASKWTGARELLSRLQIDVDEESAILTARGAALDFVSLLAAEEVVASMRDLSPIVADALSEVFAGLGLRSTDHTVSVEERFNHIWAQRTTGLGSGDPWFAR